ncbi:MAG: hypothetical protein QMC80_06680 [Thermoplasmatales archaeon]|nr:hypothetical protein [Thermoplasmatales archaeon]
MGMKIGGRVSFDRIEDLEKHFKGIDFPIELALPWKYRELWLPVENRVSAILSFFKNSNISIITIHATQGKITDDLFLVWGKKTLKIAKELGVGCITVHPNHVKKPRYLYQVKAIENLKKLSNKTCSFSVETFNGKNRVLRPMEIVEAGIPMTLDTAHIRDNQLIKQLIEKYWENIKTVHLSAKSEKEHHLPIDDFCAEIVKKLYGLNWQGNVILEYLPWHHYRVRSDIKALNKYLFEGKPLRLLPVSDQYKSDPNHYGFNEKFFG